MLPCDWKLANVVPVYKKDNKEHMENYRPISLLSLISKALERCVFNKIKDHVFDQINDGQHGFVRKFLRPLLFLLYQNNLSNSINHSKIATFADDTKIYKVINKEADASAMENDLANFQTSSANANLFLNTNTCKTLRIT